MPFFKKKPVIISAEQWTGENLFDIVTFINRGICPNQRDTMTVAQWEAYKDLVDLYGLKIHTLEGVMDASIGDWIIRGVNGEIYPCKPDIFEKTYESLIS